MTREAQDSGRLASNRRAHHDYHILERLEAGVELCGTEVKSVRNGGVSLAGSFARMAGDELMLHNVSIPAYEYGNRNNHDPERPRRLLLHRAQIVKLRTQTEQKGFALVPLAMYVKRGWIKVEIGLCRGKSRGDKRETLKRQTDQRESDREIARHYRGA